MRRRRLLRILAAAGGLAAVPGPPWPASARRHHRWRGSALGAEARIDVWLDDRARAQQLVRLCLAEVDRLERVFSLQRRDSALSALNRDGRLPRPPLELVSVLETARRVSELTDGAFDVTVQPLWRAYADHFARPGAEPDGPPQGLLERLGGLIDWRLVEAAPGEVRLAREGMAVTLNGIAQGFVADRVADLLRDEGIASVLLDVGEIVTVGATPGGDDWRVRAGAAGPVLGLVEGAVATSSPAGLTFDPAGSFPHLLDPSTLRPGVAATETTVVADRATIADALSTALSVRHALPLPTRGSVGVRQIIRRPPSRTPATMLGPRA